MSGMLIIGSGPSGAGKNSVFSEVLKLQAGRVEESVSCTTREPRPGEVEGRDYYFVSLEQFEQWEKEGYFLEAAGKHAKRRYGTPIKPVLEKLERGIDVLLVIEVNGAQVARQHMPDALTIFITPAGETLEEKMAQLQAQLQGRGSEDEQVISMRLAVAAREIELAKDYRHVVVNAPGQLERAIGEVNAIINEARRRQAGIV